jgi:hypothetical protein
LLQRRQTTPCLHRRRHNRGEVALRLHELQVIDSFQGIRRWHSLLEQGVMEQLAALEEHD